MLKLARRIRSGIADLLDDWLTPNLPIFMQGMVPAVRGGWHESAVTSIVPIKLSDII